ncbi:MAG TPA: RNA polymerase sigma-70 factor [Longimicrobiaceae bacterium]
MTRLSTSESPPGAAAAGEDPGEAAALEAALAERVRAGDAAAFEALFQRFFRRLHAFAESYVGDSETAEDLVADVFVRVWERRAEWQLRGGPRAYLYGAVRNEALAHVRRRRMLQRAHASAAADERRPGMGAPPAPSDAGLQARELAEAIELAIERLPERSREAFVLHRRHGLSYAQVAEAMEISPRTVEVHIRRAFLALRADLGGFLALLLAATLL